MFGLIVIEGMNLSGHPWIINEIMKSKVTSPFIVNYKVVASVLTYLVLTRDITISSPNKYNR